MLDLPKLASSTFFVSSRLIYPTQIELKKKYKYRLILDESLSIGTLVEREGVLLNYTTSPHRRWI